MASEKWVMVVVSKCFTDNIFLKNSEQNEEKKKPKSKWLRYKNINIVLHFLLESP